MRKGSVLSWITANRSILQRFADRLADDGSAIHEIREFLRGYIEDQIPVQLKRADLVVDGLIDWTRVLPGDLGEALEEADNSIVSDLLDLLCTAANDTDARKARLRGLTVSRLRARFPGHANRRPRVIEAKS